MIESARGIRIAAFAVAALGLAGCAQSGGVRHVAAAPAGSGTPAAFASPATLVAGVAAPIIPSRPRIALADVAALINLTDRDLMARLGRPDFRREEASAQIWQYRGTSCVLDVFLYEDGNVLRVVHATTRGRSETGSDSDRCVPELIAAG
jgi:hypothetical protein